MNNLTSPEVGFNDQEKQIIKTFLDNIEGDNNLREQFISYMISLDKKGPVELDTINALTDAQLDNHIKFRKGLNDLINEIDMEISQRPNREKRIHVKDLIYFLCLTNGNGWSMDKANFSLNIEGVLDVCKKALIERLKLLELSHLEKLNGFIIKELGKTEKPNRILAFDGSLLHNSINLVKDGCTILKNDKYYVTTLLECSYDLENEYPFRYTISSDLNENHLALDQIDSFKPGDTIIGDRFYYNYNMASKLDSMNIRALFRLTSKVGGSYINKINETINADRRKKYYDNVVIIRNPKSSYPIVLNKNETIITTARYPQEIPMVIRFIKCKIKKTAYYFATTVFDYSVDDIKDLYRMRWGIETHFGKEKRLLNLRNLNGLSLSRLKQDVLIHQFIFLLNAYQKRYSQPFDTKKYVINDTLSIHATVNYFLYGLLYDKPKTDPDAQLSKIVDAINSKKSLIPIVSNRNYDRMTKKPKTKWNRQGRNGRGLNENENKYKVKRKKKNTCKTVTVSEVT